MFAVWFTPIGEEDRRELRADIRAQVETARAALERRGCGAADYRLAGSKDDLGHICAIHLLRDWRMLVGFPAPDEVCVLVIGRHVRGPHSIYRRLYLLLEIDEPFEERRKPPCCESDQEPTTDAELVDRLIAAAKRQRQRGSLQRRQRRAAR
jgi:hypothetical protein